MLGELAPADRLKELLASRWAERDAAGGRGTEVHKIAHRLHLGEEAAYPGELAGHVEAHRDFLDTLEPKIIAAELILGNRSVRYCGTLDLVANLNPVPWTASSSRRPGGCSTSRRPGRGCWPETALQLAAYEHAEVFIAEDGAERPMSWLEIEHCAAVWIRADGWEPHPGSIPAPTRGPISSILPGSITPRRPGRNGSA